MQKVKTAQEAGKRRKAKARALPFLYVLFWSFAGAASVAYLGVIFTDPDLVNALSTPASGTSPSGRFADEQVASPAARALGDRLSNAKMELSKLRSELSEHKQAYAEEQSQDAAPSDAIPATAANEDGASAESQMTAANEGAPTPTATGVVIPGLSIVDSATQHPGMLQPSIPVIAAPEEPSPPNSVSEVAIANTTIVNGSNAGSPIETGALPVVPPPAPGVRPKPKPVAVVAISRPKPAAPKQPAPTKAVAKSTTPKSQVVAFGPATVTRAPKTVETTQKIGVRLASAPTLDALRLTWNVMRERHGDALKGLSPRYVKESVSSTGPYALVAGPVAKSTDVLEICAGLGGEVRECALATFEGRSL